MKKKIAIIIKDAYSYAGTENVCNFMTDCLGDVGDIYIYSLTGGGDTFYPFRKVKNILSLEKNKFPYCSLVRSIKKENFDTVYLISMGKLSVIFSIYALFFSLGKKTKIITCEHVSLSSFSPLIRFLKYTFLRFYNKVVVLTDVDKNSYLKAGISSVKIPNPIYPKDVPERKNEKKALAVGRLEHQKGFDLLIDIWRDFKLSPHAKDWTLTIVGDGSLRGFLAEKVASYSLNDSIFFAGKVNDMDSFYSNSDLFLMTSRYEGLPLVLLEAKSWGLPLISFDCPTGPREIITHNVDGFLIPFLDIESYTKTLNLLSSDESKYKIVKDNSHHGIDGYDPGKIKGMWLSTLE